VPTADLAPLEKRVADLEAVVQRLLRQAESAAGAPAAPVGWRGLVGLFRDDPIHAEVVRLGRANREERTERTEPERTGESADSGETGAEP